MRYQVDKGRRYRARVSLEGFEALASNEQVSEKFSEAGFVDVTTRGSGSRRDVTGTWPHASAEAEVPEQVTDVEELDD